MPNRRLSFAAFIVGVALAAPAMAQFPKPPVAPVPPGPPSTDPLAVLQKLTGSSSADVLQAVRGLAAYPERTRRAILDFAAYSEKHPSLLADLERLRGGPSDAIDHYLTSNDLEPELQRAAAVVLVEAPETIDQMQERPEMVRTVGAAWSTPPGRQLISALLDAAAGSLAKTQSAAADRWAGRLKADPKLLTQYTHLLDEYTGKTTAAGQQPDDTWKSYGYGTYKADNGYVVDDVPSKDVINYALAVGPQYPAVAEALIQQYLAGSNSDDYNSAVGFWFAAYGSSIPQSTQDANSDYYALLQELSSLAAALASSGSGYGDTGNGDLGAPGNGSGNTGAGDNGAAGNGSGNNSGNGSGDNVSVNAPSNLLNANPSNYPKLANWAAKNPAPKLGSPSDLNRLKNPPAGQSPLTGKSPIGSGAAPFSDLMKATPANQRALPSPKGSQNPFNIAGKPAAKPNLGQQPGGVPSQMFRASPSMSQQLTRAPAQMQAAWHPRPAAGPRPGGLRR